MENCAEGNGNYVFFLTQIICFTVLCSYNIPSHNVKYSLKLCKILVTCFCTPQYSDTNIWLKKFRNYASMFGS